MSDGIMDEHRGLSYEAASRKAQTLLVNAAKSGHWWPIVEQLVSLRAVMQRHLERKSA